MHRHQNPKPSQPRKPALKPEQSLSVILGRVGKPHGLRGDIIIESYCDPKIQIADYGVLTSEHGPLELTSLRPHKNQLLAQIKNCPHINLVEKYSGCTLSVPRAQLPGEYGDYLHDFLHYQYYESGQLIGAIIGFADFGAGDLMVVESSDKNQEYYVFDREILNIDHQTRILTRKD